MHLARRYQLPKREIVVHKYQAEASYLPVAV